MQHLEQRLFQRGIAVRRTQIEHFRAFAAKHRIHANLQFFDGKKFFSRARHHKGERIFRHVSREAAKDFLSAFIGEKQLPANPPVAIQHRRRGRRDLQSVTVSLDERAASDVALNQAFGFQLGVSIRYRGAVNAEHGRELAARRNAVAGTQISRVHEGAQLVAKLDVQRNVALWLEMEWKHCLSPSANSTRYWPGARANLSFSFGSEPTGLPFSRSASAGSGGRFYRTTLGNVLTVPLRVSKLTAMVVHLKPETESRLQELAATTGRAPDELVEDAMAGYLAELVQVRKMLDRRYDEIKSGRVESIDGKEAFDRLRRKSEDRRH